MEKIDIFSIFLKQKHRIHFVQRDEVSKIRFFYKLLGAVSAAKQFGMKL